MIRILLLGLIFSVKPLIAAAPITHAYLAQIWSEEYLITDPMERQAFIAGNLFPDIRYLGTISRKKTHEKNITPKKIEQAKNQFRSGMRLHVFVDVQRENFIDKCNVMSHLKEIPSHYRVQFLKLIEDEILWSKHSWKEAQDALLSTYDEQKVVGVSEETTVEWHTTMIAYFENQPSIMLKNKAMNNEDFLKVDRKTVALWSEILPLYAKDPYFITYVDRMLSNLILKFTPLSN